MKLKKKLKKLKAEKQELLEVLKKIDSLTCTLGYDIGDKKVNDLVKDTVKKYERTT